MTNGCRDGLGMVALTLAAALAAACGGAPDEMSMEAPAEAEAQAPAPAAAMLPPSADTAMTALETSPRHGEWADVALDGADAPLTAWVVYPERSGPAPVVLVIHEIFGLTDWIRGVADQFAAEGFIAVAPDLLTGMGPDGGNTDAFASRDDVVAAIRGLAADERTRRLDAVRDYALAIPAANGRLGTVGFCWGGMSSFAYAVSQPELNAAVVYYGTSPEAEADFAQIAAPVLGLYGEDDERVNATIPRAQDALGDGFEAILYDAAGHGFLRAQTDRDGANLRATEQAWPRTLEFFREHLEG